ncbi:MAG TPA: DUF5916 domain-containing protein [Gemmatimonadales bacterium]|nr:DUF5916 domain-containing protein [Gemmatimonadales bacterium]
MLRAPLALPLILVLVLARPAVGLQTAGQAASGADGQPPAAVISGRGAPTVTIPRVDDAEIVVDGELSEPAWRQAIRLGEFSQFQPVDGRPAEERTEVLVWYAPDAIHFGVMAHDRYPASIRATRADRDNIGNDDHITIYLDTFNDRRRAYLFAVNPLGIQQDGVRSEGAQNAGSLIPGSVDFNPDFYFQSKGRLTAEGYVVEIRIPFKSLRYQGNGPQRWGLNIVRKVQRTGYEDTWTDVRRASASFLGQAGSIDGLRDLERGVALEAQPFATASANGRRAGSGRFVREELDPSAGLNLRLGFTNLTLDATLNPDFSQVESDAGQVTLNERFALFFPEKRPFFLEGIELFATPNQLVYTRQIADPIVGGKVTGKFGALGVAHLTALDETGADDALFNVTRVRRDFGRNSIVGLTFTDRSGSGDYNRVLAADARIVFARLYFVEGQLGRSWTHEAGATRGDPIWKLEFDRTGRSWGFNYAIEGVGDAFETRSGFVNRTGIVSGHVMNRLTWYGQRGALLENFTTFFGPRRIWRYDAFGSDGAIEGGEEINLDFRLRGGWTIEPRIERDFVRFLPGDYAGYEVDLGGTPQPFVPPEEVAGLSVSLDVSTPTFRSMNASAEVGYGRVAIFPEAGEGRELRVGGELHLRPTGALRIEASTILSRITRERGGEFARTIIPRLKVEYQATRALFFRVIGEHRSERQAALADPRSGGPILIGGVPQPARERNGLRVDWLASFEPSPGTVAFVGYGSSMESGSSSRLSDIRRTSDGFFVKLAYQFRR